MGTAALRTVRLTPSPNGNGKPHPPSREEKIKRALKAPTQGYRPGNFGWWGWGTAALDGRPIFTWLDVQRMFTDSKIIFCAQLWRAPFQKVEFTVKASSPKVAAFVQNTIKRFWRASLPKLLSRYFKWGFAAGGAEYEAVRGKLRLARVRALECNDVRPRVFTAGAQAGRFAGFSLARSGAGGQESTLVGVPHAFWFAGQGDHGTYYDRPPLAGAFEPWLEKNGRGGAVHMCRLWYRKNAARGMEIRYPPGVSNIGSEENPQLRDNQDIAREIADYHETNATLALENTLQPGDNGKYEWEVNYAESHNDIAGFLDYREKLDRDIVEGTGIPLEVIQGSDSGSGYKGRLVSYGGFLGVVDELAGLILESCDTWLKPLVGLNYGPDAWYEVEPVSLAKIAAEEEKRQPTNPVGQPLASLPPGDGGGGGSGAGASPLQLSVTAPPAPDNSAVLGAIERLAASVLALATAKSQPLELAATAAPANEEATKQTAFTQTQSRLMRVRKSTIAQLLALAMLRKQQEATAAGKPEAAAGSLEALANLASDPMQVARIVGMRDLSALELAWTAFQTKSGSTGAESDNLKDALGRPKKLYGKAAAAALRAQEGRLTRDQSEARGKEILAKVGAKRASLEEVAELATHLPKMRLAEINKARAALEHFADLNMRGEKTKRNRIDRILDHVEKRAGKPDFTPRAPETGREKKPKAAPAPEVAPESPVAAPEPATVGAAAAPDGTVAPLAAAGKKPAAPPVPKVAGGPIDQEGAKPKPNAAQEAIDRATVDTSRASDATRTSLGDALVAIERAGLKVPRLAIVRDDPSLAVPATSHGVMVTVNPAAHAELVRNDAEARKRWGRPITVDSSLAGVMLHELTHSKVLQMPEGERTAAIAEADKMRVGAKKWLSMRAETDADELLSELSVAYIQGKPLPPEATALAERVWGKKGESATAPEPAKPPAPPKPEPTPAPKPAPGAAPDLEAWSQKALAHPKLTFEQRKAVVAAGRLGKVLNEKGNPDRVLQAYNQLAGEADALPAEDRQKFLDGVRARLPAAVRADLDAQPTPGDGDDDAPEEVKPSSVKDILAEEAATLAKRRAKANPAPAAPAPKEAAKVAEAVKEEVAKPVPAKKPAAKPKKAGATGKPAAVVPEAKLARDPGADKRALAALAKAAPSDAARETILDAEHNVPGGDSQRDYAPAERRRYTVERLAAAWRDAHDRGDTESADYAAGALKQFGAELHGPEPGATTEFDGRRYDSEHSVASGPVRVVRRPVVLRYPDGTEHVAVKGKVGPVGG